MIFKDRKEAGKYLAEKLIKYKNSGSVIFALPRGGVVVGAEIAKILNIPLDVAIARKIGHPFNPEYAVCALSESGNLICDEDEKKNLSEEWLEKAVNREKKEIARRRSEYSLIKEPISPRGKTAILVDDGIATGLTMKAAIAWTKNQKTKKIIVAIPVVPAEIAEELKKQIDELVALEIPEYYLGSVGSYYINFDQITDDEVKKYLSRK